MGPGRQFGTAINMHALTVRSINISDCPAFARFIRHCLSTDPPRLCARKTTGFADRDDRPIPRRPEISESAMLWTDVGSPPSWGLDSYP